MADLTEHTPGPWRVLPEEADKPYIRVRGTRLGCRYKVANVLTLVYDGVHEREARETLANARLIAAAPTLLAACRRAEQWLEGWASAEPYLSEFRAAIAEATGAQQE